MIKVRYIVLLASCVVAIGDETVQAQSEAGMQAGTGELFQGARYSTSKLAEVWGLKEAEIERYQELRITDQHYSDSKITPYEVLGKYARNAEEAERYAAIVVEKELEQYIRVMDWSTTVDNVRKDRPIKAQLEMLQSSRVVREYLSQNGINTTNWINELSGQPSLKDFLGLKGLNQSQFALPPVSRVSYFVEATDCDEACESRWENLRGMQTNKAVAGIDVVFVGDKEARPSKLEVSSWAQARGISVEEVDRKEVTLNFESERFAKIRASRDAPVAIDSHGDIIQ